ncbi:hypothetical protein EVAR_46701_1 [Eumeta japonica]|uniref:Uncharacterized protein n=1 Tax=Eumeta variegata TaxID=151549 RepID=A0A4C1XBB1_EUMVA|nr:hypothetical protein EVAR_46701_1 [Eumeta japonica]
MKYLLEQKPKKKPVRRFPGGASADAGAGAGVGVRRTGRAAGHQFICMKRTSHYGPLRCMAGGRGRRGAQPRRVLHRNDDHYRYHVCKLLCTGITIVHVDVCILHMH